MAEPGEAAANRTTDAVALAPAPAFPPAPGSLIEREATITIGVVGTSRGGLVDNRTAREHVAEALSRAVAQIRLQAADYPITIVSGGGLVPNYAFDWARKNGNQRLQVVSAAVH